MHLRSIFTAAVLLSASFAAHADSILTGTFTITVHEGLSNGTATPNQSFSATNVDPFGASSTSGTAYASFTYTGPLSFSNTAGQNGPSTTTPPSGDLNSLFFTNPAAISGYTGSGTVTYGASQVADYRSLASFLASSGSASNFAYGSYYTIALGTQAKGTVFTVTHDDGASIYQGSTLQPGLTSGATSAVTEKVTLAGNGATTLYYGRENGSPSVLTVATSATPEPSSLALLGTGLLGIAGAVRKRIRA